MLNQPNSLLSNPNYGPKSGSPLLSVAAADGFADSGFAGAFKSDAEADQLDGRLDQLHPADQRLLIFR